MFKKIRAWFKRKQKVEVTIDGIPQEGYTYEQLENAYKLGYNDGKIEGLSIARVQATKSLKEILWQQNQSKK
jgi:hypothetical protein